MNAALSHPVEQRCPPANSERSCVYIIKEMAIEIVNWSETPPSHYHAGALAIGNFDGVHRGHLGLLSELRIHARACAGPAVAMTFDPHPLKLLRPAQFQPVLTTMEDRAALLVANGADHVVILRTVPEFLQLSAAEFFRNVVQERLEARALVEGTNFGFGRNREGNIDTLGDLCRHAAIKLVVVPPMKWNGLTVASSRVRGALLRGDVREATDLMSRPYRLRGIVRTGKQRGQSLGFPTANLEDIQTLVPADGVYAVRVHYHGRRWPGAANIGTNPTFGEETRKIEVHLVGFHGDLVGQMLELDLIDRLRDTRPFPGAAQLIEQLRLDVERARELAS
jgi:riboflavin kinase/FMN adenylyltransferase